MSDELATRMVRGGDLDVGDTLSFLGKGYRIVSFDDYAGPLSDIVDRIANVEGHGAFMSICRGQSYRVLA